MEGWVYFLRVVPDGVVKIGWTKNDPGIRCDAIRTGSAVPLEVLGAIAAESQAEERRLHTRFRQLWSHGEWFRPGPDLLAFIEANVRPCPGGLELARDLAMPVGHPGDDGRALFECAEAVFQAERAASRHAVWIANGIEPHHPPGMTPAETLARALKLSRAKAWRRPH